MIGEVSIAAATAVVDYDLLRDKEWKSASYPRLLQSVALTGSAAAGDSIVELFINSEKVAELYNVATGFPLRDHFLPVNRVIPAGGVLLARVKDAPATNPINLTMLFSP